MLDNAKTQIEFLNWHVGISVVIWLDTTKLKLQIKSWDILFSRQQQLIVRG